MYAYVPLFCCAGYVTEQNVAVVESCGKYNRILTPGMYCLTPVVESIAGTRSLRIGYDDFICDTKTKDNVFVKVVINVQYKVMEDKVPSAYYKLTDPRSQIRSYVFDVVRSSVPRLDLDEAFASKDDIANSVKSQVSGLMTEYGYEIIAVLVTDLDPNAHVKAAMNEINASSRLREAAAERAEAEKILQVKAAEAEAESKYLSGLGVAKQRAAIMDGLKSAVYDFSHEVDGTAPKDVMDLLLVTQYFDMLREMHKRNSSNTIFLPHGPQAVTELKDNLKNYFSMNQAQAGKK